MGDDLPKGVAKYAAKRNLADKTRETYAMVYDQMDEADPAGWLTRRVEGAPLGTVLPFRAAVRHFLAFELGWTSEEIADALPDHRGHPSRLRGALNREQRDVLAAALDELPPVATTFILRLIEKTGLRCAEACGLRVEDVRETELHVLGKGRKIRKVPLGAARKVITTWLDLKAPSDWLFPSPKGTGSLQPQTVRFVTRKLRQDYPILGKDFSPHVLRHTWATKALSRGLNVVDVGGFLGHASLDTTRRYLHADPDTRDALMRQAQGESGDAD